jgi:hypothetical protein
MKFQIEGHLKTTPWNKIKANEVSEAFPFNFHQYIFLLENLNVRKSFVQ